MLDLFGIEKRKRRRALWTKIAHEHGGEFHLAKGFWRRKNERIEASVAGVPFVLDTYVVSTGKSSQTYSRITAPLAHGPGARMHIYKHGVLASIGNIFVDDHPLGFADLDQVFVVRSDHAAVTRRLMTARAAELLVATFRDGKLTCKDNKLELLTAGLWAEEPRLRHAIEIIGELAARDIYGVAALRAIDGGVLGTNERGWPIAEVASSSRVVIGAEDHDGRLVMTARTSEPVAALAMELEIVDGVARDGERANRLPPGAHVALRNVGTCVLAITDKGMHVRWPELELDPARLRAGADLLGAIAAGQQATQYR